MNERQKILESIKKGILSPEEGLDLLESLGLNEETKSESAPETEEEPIVEEPSATETVEEPVNKLEQEETSQHEAEFEGEIKSKDFLGLVEDEEKTEIEKDLEFDNDVTIEKISESDLADDDLLEQPAFEEPAEAETELVLEPETPEEALSEKPQSSDSVSSMIDEWENKKSEPKEEDPVRSKIDEFG